MNKKSLDSTRIGKSVPKLFIGNKVILVHCCLLKKKLGSIHTWKVRYGILFIVFLQCVLAAIIMEKMRGMLLQARDLKILWNISLTDFVSIEKANIYMKK